MSDTLLKDLLSALDLMVLERKDSGKYEAVGQPPEWFRWIYPNSWSEESGINLHHSSPFLENFLIDAEAFWAKNASGQLRSGSWEEKGGIGKEDHLEATAMSLGGRKILLIQLLGAAHEERRRMLQIARERALLQHRLLKEIQKKEILLHCLATDLVRLIVGTRASFPLLHAEKLSPAGSEYLAHSEQSLALQEKMVNEILQAFADDMDTPGPFQLDLQNVPDVYVSLRQVINEMTGTAALHKIALKLDPVPDPSRDWRVIGDTTRLKRVVTNLIENALLASPAFSSVIIGIKAEEGHIVLTVDDDGEGVSSDLLGTLFHKFASTESGSIGFGLYFCRIMVERWGGTIGHLPRSPRGSRFWIRLPRFVAI